MSAAIDGLCAQVDPELFFPPVGSRATEAKAVCAACPAQVACLRWAMANPVEGVWGGTSTNDRRQLARAAGQTYAGNTSSPYAGPQLLCGTEAAQKRHRRAGQSCTRCRVGA